MVPKRNLLLSGFPGVGKTTILRRVALALTGRRLAGFLTEEIREQDRRLGFQIAPFNGQPRTLAHVGFPGPHRVGRYGVDVKAIEHVADEALGSDPEVEVYLIDEIGKMECLSERFVAMVRGLLDSNHLVVATIARRGGGFIAEAKRRDDSQLWKVTVQNRDKLVHRILNWLAT